MGVGYEIRFWREVTNSHGHPFRVILARFAITKQPPSDRELGNAIAEFCRTMHVCRWGVLAHGYDIADTDRLDDAGEPCCIESRGARRSADILHFPTPGEPAAARLVAVPTS
jgi:hypothetical protein